MSTSLSLRNSILFIIICTQRSGTMAKFEPKYFIGDYSLKEYCLLHDYNYSSARNMISSTRKKHPEWSDDEMLKDVVSRLRIAHTKYYFAGTTLNKYCREHKIVSSTVRRIYQRLINSLGGEFSEESIMKKAVELAQRGREKYLIDNVKLSLYCEENGINKGSIISSISQYRRIHSESELSDEEIVKEVLEHHRTGYSTYYVGEETFSSYVLRHGYNPSSVFRKLWIIHPEIKSSERKIYIDEKYVQEVIQSMLPDNGTLYFYGDTKLRQYCLKNDLNYVSILGTVAKNPHTPLDDIVKKAHANKARRVHQRDRILLKEKETDETYVINYIVKYGIDQEQYVMMREHFSPFAAVSAIEYFGFVDESRIQEILEALSRENKSLDDAILLVNLGYYENVYYAVKWVEGLIVNVINEVATDKKKYSEYREYLEEYIYTILVDRCYMFTPGGFINYLRKSLKHKLIKYINEECVSLKEFGLTGTYSIERTFEEKERASKVREALSCLSEWEVCFVYRRFGFQSDKMILVELQQHYYSDCTIDELNNIEISILDKLRNSSILKGIK